MMWLERKPFSFSYEILRSLIAPTKVSEKNYDEIIHILNEHFAPRASEIVCRFKFYRRDQQPGESIAVYIKELRHLAEHCGFRETLEAMLRDRLVCGVQGDALQRRLLAEDKITFKKALDMCQAHEVAAHSVATLKEAAASRILQPQPVDINKVSKGKEKANSGQFKK
ncbi:hypothetical protein NQ317_015475 [Molorchus minor]|uniref:Retrotransposon gag domain-containing protein n=1 Tax=Molorchus minor TaxID=1323400 RepID=A0ABQ9J9Y2_9CUCU|nr:hypothetical protein NQ317_015475 [Molorchus minor]